MKRPVLFIVGPTAVGKSEMAIRLAKHLSGEIISADSMQIYRGMDIGTAKPSLHDRAQIPHHLIDILEPSEEFSAFHFYEKTLSLINDIANRNKVPMIVGGTGFYIRSLLQGIHSELPKSADIRLRYEQEVCDHGLESVYQELKEKDPERAMKIAPQDKKRIIRALEILEISGMKPSQLPQTYPSFESLGFRSVVCGILFERKNLYERIHQRVDQMIQSGWVDECRKLLKIDLSVTAFQAIGYREIFRHLQNPEQYSIEQAADDIKLHTRHLARRQIIWFKKEKEIQWFDGAESLEAFQGIENRWRGVLKNAT